MITKIIYISGNIPELFAGPQVILGDICNFGFRSLQSYKDDLLKVVDTNDPINGIEVSTLETDVITNTEVTRFEVEENNYRGRTQEQYPEMITSEYLNLVLEVYEFYEQYYNDRPLFESIVGQAFDEIKSNPNLYKIQPDSDYYYDVTINGVLVRIQLRNGLADLSMATSTYVNQLSNIR